MKIKINDEWGIKSDRFQYFLCKIVKKEDEEDYFKPILSTYKTIGDVLQAYVERKVKVSEGLKSFREVKEMQEDILEEIQDIKEELDIEKKIEREVK